jgi:hypothetical protein
VIELAVLATSVVTQLVVPFLRKGWGGISEAVDADAADLAKKAYDKVRAIFVKHGHPEPAALDHAMRTDEGVKELIETLKVLLEQDQEAASELQQLVEQPASVSGQTVGSQIAQNITVTVSNAWIGGDVTGVDFGGRSRRVTDR